MISGKHVGRRDGATVQDDRAAAELATALQRGAERRLEALRRGLIPFWAKDAKIAYSTINALAEIVATKPAFRDAFKDRRCLVPADAWKDETAGRKAMAARARGSFILARGASVRFRRSRL